jgi:hypothetical protein
MLQVWTFPNGNICKYTGTYSQLAVVMGDFDANLNLQIQEWFAPDDVRDDQHPADFQRRHVELRTGNGCFRTARLPGSFRASACGASGGR